jgi:hypothetical protein
VTTFAASAGVEPWTVFLSSDNSSGPNLYTVPAGKVLIISHYMGSVTSTPPSQTDIRVIFYADNIPPANSYATIEVKPDFRNGIWRHLDKPCTMRASDRLAVPTNYRLSRYRGLLLDAEDLYAQNIPADLTDPQVSGGKLMATAKFASPRPRITRIESATDPASFTEDATGTTGAGASPDTAQVSVDAGANERLFMRVAATALPRKDE